MVSLTEFERKEKARAENFSDHDRMEDALTDRMKLDPFRLLLCEFIDSPWCHICEPAPLWPLRKDRDCSSGCRNIRSISLTPACWSFDACVGRRGNVSAKSWLPRKSTASAAFGSSRTSCGWSAPCARSPSVWLVCNEGTRKSLKSIPHRVVRPALTLCGSVRAANSWRAWWIRCTPARTSPAPGGRSYGFAPTWRGNRNARWRCRHRRSTAKSPDLPPRPMQLRRRRRLSPGQRRPQR